jgi:putative DNA primase/helicase
VATPYSRYFSPDFGLMASRAASAVRDGGPLMRGADGRLWAYAGGVWSPGDREVAARVVALLGDRYRPHHRQAIVEVLGATLDVLHVRPVSEFVNMPNGLVRWASPDGPTLIDHHPESFSTVQLPVEFVPGSECPEFERFLTEAVAPDDQARVWELIGYLMMSGNPLQRLFLFTGGGGNGKGVLLDVIKRVLGPSNVSSVPLHDFADNRFATAELVGKLANICGDIDATFIEKTGMIKQLAGEDTIKAERKGEQQFDFDFFGKMLFSANAIPQAADSSTGWLRRWEIVHFPNAPAAPDIDLKRRLTSPESLQGIAYRALRALPTLMGRRAFDRGEAANRAFREFAERNNLLLQWLADEEHGGYYDETGFYPRRVFWQAFRRWYEENNPSGRVMGTQGFYERCRQIKGIREVKRGVYGWAGIRLHKDTIYVDLTGETAPSGQTEHPTLFP